MRIDHVIYGVHELDAAAERLQREHGLGFIRGGRHPGGTVNAIAPIEPPMYVELIAVEDPAGDTAPFVASAMDGEERFIGWVLEPDDIDAVAARLGLPVQEGSIRNDDGSGGSWRVVHASDPALPGFISYEGDAAVRTRRWAQRRADAGNNWVGRVTYVEVAADRDRMREWIGDDSIPVRCVDDDRGGVLAVGIASERGELVLT